MNGREIIKAIMAKQNINNSALANRLGITQAALWDRIDTQPRKGKPRKDIPVSLLSEMVQVMDYKVVVIPSSARLPKDGYCIGDNESLQIDSDALLSDPETSEKTTGKRIKLTPPSTKIDLDTLLSDAEPTKC